MKYVAVHKDQITQAQLKSIGSFEPRIVGDYFILKLKNEFNDLFSGFTKMSDSEARIFIDRVEQGLRVEEKPIPEFQLPQLTPNQRIPKVAVYDAEGDFNSIVSHDFTDPSTWPNTDDSTFIVAPPDGKVMFLKKAEVQFTHDIVFSGVTELYFDIWGFNPADLPNKTIYERVVYASIKDVLNVGNSHFTMPPCDNITNSMSTVQFNYPRSIPLQSSFGLEIRCSLKDHTPIQGEFVTVTFLTSVEDEL